MPHYSPLTIVALAISPIVTVVFASLYWRKRDSVSQPSIVAAAALNLSSIALLLEQSAFLLLRTFNEIATGKAAGARAVIAGLLRVQEPLAWGFLDCAACLIVLFLVSGALRYSMDEEGPFIHAYVALPALILTSVFLVCLFLMVYLQYGTVDLVMKIVDNHRHHEIVLQYGPVSPGYFAAKISFRLVAIFFLSQLEFVLLIIGGALVLFWRQKQNSRQPFATIITVGALISCGVSALSEFGFIDYLQHVL